MNNGTQLRNIFSMNVKSKNHSVQQIPTADSCLKRSKIPQNISADKVQYRTPQESLYEQLLVEKSRNKQMYKDLNSLTLYQKTQDELIDSAPVSRKHVHQLLFKKEQELQSLKQSQQFREIQELRKQLDQVRSEMQSQMILKSHKEDIQWIVDDNLDLVRQIETLQSDNQYLSKSQAQLITLKAAHKQQQKVLALKDLQLEKYRSRDPLQDVSIKQKSKHDQILLDELEQKKDEIYNLQTQIANLKRILTEEQKLHQALQLEHTNKMNAWENERLVLKERLNYQMKENQILIDKCKLMDRYMTTQKKKSMILDDPNNANSLKFISQSKISDDQIVRCVRKTDIQSHALVLKYNLRRQNISIKQAEELLFTDKQTISITQIQRIISTEPFSTRNSHMISRYLVEDNQQEDYAYNPEVEVPVAVVKCVFRTMLENYQPLDQEIIEEVSLVTSKIKDNFGTQPTVSLQQLKEFISKIHLQCSSTKFIDAFCQLYFNKYQQFQDFEVAKL